MSDPMSMRVTRRSHRQQAMMIVADVLILVLVGRVVYVSRLGEIFVSNLQQVLAGCRTNPGITRIN
jgi:hypothetical protein